MPDFPPTINTVTTKPNPENGRRKLWEGGTIRATRADILSKVAASGLPDAHKAVLVYEIGKIDAQHDMLRLDYNRHGYKAGSSGGWTITEL